MKKKTMLIISIITLAAALLIACNEGDDDDDSMTCEEMRPIFEKCYPTIADEMDEIIESCENGESKGLGFLKCAKKFPNDCSQLDHSVFDYI